jgi:hypothetical protein
MLDWFLDHPLIVAIPTLTLVCALVVWDAVYEQQQWDNFSAQHHCRQIAHKEATAATTLLTDGKVGITTIPAENTFACDDGQQYTRAD